MPLPYNLYKKKLRITKVLNMRTKSTKLLEENREFGLTVDSVTLRHGQWLLGPGNVLFSHKTYVSYD